ncbi:MAG: GH25 family lysozyme [Eubacterium sp.]
MKKGIIKIFSAFLALIIMLESTTLAFASVKSKSSYTGTSYTHQAKFDWLDVINGIDVSEHNGEIDFNKVKKNGIEFVFVRVGYTGYTKSCHSLNYDKNYKTYLKNAINAGLKVGVYWYSQALTANEAKKEAQKVLDVIGKYDITMPVVFDYEFAGTSAGRLDSANLSKTKMTENALAFLDKISNAGYDACLYASENFLKDHMLASKITQKYKVWLANYCDETNYSGEYEFWQYSSKGKVKGIEGNTDVNFWYTGEVTDLKKQYYTGKPVTPKPDKVTTSDGVTLKYGTDYELKYQSNTEVGYALVTAVGIGDYEGFEKKYRFEIIPKQATGLTLKARTTTTLTYKWNAVKGAKSYQLYVKNVTKGTSFYVTTSTNTIKIGNLTPANEYSVKVCVGMKNKSGDIIYGTYSKANEKHTLPGQVTNLRVKSRTTTSVTLTWDKMSGADGYRVYRYYSSTGQYKLVKEIAGAGNTKLKISNLKSGSTYSYKVSAYTEDTKKKVGKKSKLLTVTPKPEAVTLKSVSNPSTQKIKVKFTEVKCSGYQIQWSTTKDFSSDKKLINVSAKKGTTATIKTAKRNRYYYVRVRAYKTVNGVKTYGAWSNAKKIKVK